MKTSKLWKYLRRFVYVVLGCYCLVILLISTYPGTRILLAITKYAAGKQLQIGRVSGTLTAGLHINNLSYQSDHTNAEVGAASVKLNLLSLLRAHIFINQLAINNATIQITGTNETSDDDSETEMPSRTTTSSSSSSFWLRFLDVNLIDINNVKLLIDEKTYQLQLAQVRRTNDRTYEYQIDTSQGTVQGTLAFTLSPTFTWNVITQIKGFNLLSLWTDEPSSLNLSLQSQGEWSKKAKLADLSIDDISGNIDSHAVSGGAAIHYQNGELAFDKFHLFFGNTHLEANGGIGKQSNLTWNLDIPNLKIFSPDMKGALLSEGKIVGTMENPVIHANTNITHFKTGDIKIRNLNMRIDTINATLNDINLMLNINNIKSGSMTLKTASLKAKSHLTDDKLIVNLDGHLDQSTTLSGNITLPDFQDFANLHQPIHAKIHFNTPDIGNLPIQTPYLKDLGGNILADLTITGRINKPTWAFKANIANGTVTSPVYGTTIRGINVTASSTPAKPLAIHGSLLAGAGKATFKGNLALSNHDYQLGLTLDGNNLQIANSHEYKLRATPSIKFNMNSTGANLTGNVLIPYARIHPVDFTSVDNIPDETKFVHQKSSESTFYRDLVMDIEGMLGDDVKFKYDALKAKLHGKLRIKKERGAPPTATGELYTQKGQYRAYGTHLNIATGRIMFTNSPLSNPALDIKATKEVRRIRSQETGGSEDDIGEGTLIVGLQVKGIANKPLLSFFSQPGGLNQKDILSYIAFGTPKPGAAGGLALVNSLSPTGNTAGGITDKIERSLGLDDLSLSSTDVYNPDTDTTTNTKTIGLGKKINRDLSIHYSIGLINPVSVINVRYRINRHLILNAEASTTESGADLMYTLERK